MTRRSRKEINDLIGSPGKRTCLDCKRTEPLVSVNSKGLCLGCSSKLRSKNKYRDPISSWKKYSRCISCKKNGKDGVIHEKNGLCLACCRREKAAHIKQNPSVSWGKGYNSCQGCRTIERGHYKRGYCLSCWKKDTKKRQEVLKDTLSLRCRMCEKEALAREFVTDASSTIGFINLCRVCSRKIHLKGKKKDPERYKAYGKKWDTKNAHKLEEYAQRSYDKNKEKRKLMRKATYSGRRNKRYRYIQIQLQGVRKGLRDRPDILKSFLEELYSVYNRADILNKNLHRFNDNYWEVDHMVPLIGPKTRIYNPVTRELLYKGDAFIGLHRPHNLQLLPNCLNKRKLGKWDGTSINSTWLEGIQDFWIKGLRVYGSYSPDGYYFDLETGEYLGRED